MRIVPPRPAATARDDTGHTLVELLVSMGIFSTVLAVMATAVTILSADVRKSQNLSTATDTVRSAFSRMDKQLRYASAINRPVRVGDDWYVEFETVDGTNTDTCRQWRLVHSTQELQQRSWEAPGPPATTPDFSTVATSAVNDPGTQQPFTFTAATASVPAQMLTVHLVVTRGALSNGTVDLSTSFVGRNTDVTTTTNTDTDGDGISDTPVCQAGVGRP